MTGQPQDNDQLSQLLLSRQFNPQIRGIVQQDPDKPIRTAAGLRNPYEDIVIFTPENEYEAASPNKF